MPATKLGTAGAKFNTGASTVQLTVTPTALAAGIALLSIGTPVSFVDGTGNGAMNLAYSVAAQALTTTPVSVTINNGSVTDALNNTCTFAKVKAITVQAPTTNTAAILLTGVGLNQVLGAATSLNPGITLNPGGVFSYADPNGVSVASNAVFTFTAASGNQTAAILIAGNS